jgi:hypothetical protein
VGHLHEASGFEVIDIEETIETRTTKSGNTEEITWISCLARQDRGDILSYLVVERTIMNKRMA